MRNRAKCVSQTQPPNHPHNMWTLGIGQIRSSFEYIYHENGSSASVLLILLHIDFLFLFFVDVIRPIGWLIIVRNTHQML